MELANSHKGKCFAQAHLRRVLAQTLTLIFLPPALGSYVKFESDHINWFNTVRSFLYSNKVP